MKNQIRIEKDLDYVGLKSDDKEFIFAFPYGYNFGNKEDRILNKEDYILRKDIKKIMSVIRKCKKANPLSINGSEDDNDNLPFEDYIYLIEYYLQHNRCYYMEKEISYRNDTRGKIDWSKTIKRNKPYIQDDEIVYLKQTIRESKLLDNTLITELHKYCTIESINKLGFLYGVETKDKSSLKIDEKNKNMYIQIIHKYMSKTHDNNKIRLFSAMINVINNIDTKDKSVNYYTEEFRTVWEYMIDNVYGIKNKNEYYPHGKYKGKEEKKIDEDEKEQKEKQKTALRPDSIMKLNNEYYVLDAKYYKEGNLPNSSDINKQITYAEKVKYKEELDDLYNAFILPYDGKGVDNIKFDTYGYGDWYKLNKNYHRVAVIYMDTKYLLDIYNKTSEKIKHQKDLAKEIQKIQEAK